MNRGPLCDVAECANPSPNGRVCQDCLDTLEQALGDVGAIVPRTVHGQQVDPLSLADELAASVNRRAVPPGPAGQPGTDTPLPFHWHAADLVFVLHNTLGTWARILAENYPPGYGPVCEACMHGSCGALRVSLDQPTGDSARVARWLMRHLDRARSHPAAGEIVDEITHAVRAAERAIGRPPSKWFAGPCMAELDPDWDVNVGARSCTADLYAPTGAGTTVCRRCGSRCDIDERRPFLLAAARNVRANATVISRAVTWLGEHKVTPGKIRLWGSKNRLWDHGPDSSGYPTYRVGDVQDLLVEDAARQAERDARRGVA